MRPRNVLPPRRRTTSDVDRDIRDAQNRRAIHEGRIRQILNDLADKLAHEIGSHAQQTQRIELLLEERAGLQ